MPARYVWSRTRTSCSRRNDGPGGGSRSGTAARIAAGIGQAGGAASSLARWASASGAGGTTGVVADRFGGFGFGWGLAQLVIDSVQPGRDPLDLMDDGL